MTSATDLDRRLQSLAADLDWPEAADLTVGLTLPPRRAAWLRPQVRVALASIALLVVAMTVVLVASPATRSAVARLLGFPGVAVEVGTEPLPELSGIDLGEPVTLAEAEARTGLPVRTLPLAGQRVHVDNAADAVHIAYRYKGGRVALLTQLRGGVDPAFSKQSPDVLPTEVDGNFALWVTGGGEHAVLRTGGKTVEGRLSQNALLWAEGGVTYRLEIAAELPEAVRLAEQLR